MSSVQTLEQAEGNGFEQPLVVHSFTECSSEGGKDSSLMELRFQWGGRWARALVQWAAWQVVAQGRRGIQGTQDHRRSRRPAGDTVCVPGGKGASQ